MRILSEEDRQALVGILYRELVASYDKAVMAGAQPERLRTILEGRVRRLRSLD